MQSTTHNLIRSSRPGRALLTALVLMALLGTVPAVSAAVPPPGSAAALGRYAELVHQTYAEVSSLAHALHRAVDALVREPRASTLRDARAAWLAARPAYGRSEAFRFYDGPIDFADPLTGDVGPEGRLNAWPLNEAYIDAVIGAPASGIVNDPAVPITPAALLQRNQRDDEAEVTTGWHAIEFLLWGQDLDPAGPGGRTAADFQGERLDAQRRRAYLQAATALLVADLKELEAAWAPGRPGNYRSRFLAMDPAEALGRVFSGLATLSGFELASERLGTALDSGDQEDEQSCFSDNTHADILANTEGVAAVYFGGQPASGHAGLNALVAGVDSALDARLTAALERSQQLAAAVHRPFDQVLASAPGSDTRAGVEALITALYEQTRLLREAGDALGISVEMRTE